MAMNIIKKERKEITWIGLPTNSSQECQKIEVSNKQLSLMQVEACGSPLCNLYVDFGQVCFFLFHLVAKFRLFADSFMQEELIECQQRIKQKKEEARDLLLQVSTAFLSKCGVLLCVCVCVRVCVN